MYFHSKQRSKIPSSTTSLPLKAKNHTTYLHYYTSFRHCTMRFPSSALHLVTPLPHSHPSSNNNTYIPNKRKWHKGFNAIKHLHISIRWSSLFPCNWEQKLLAANNKENILPWKTLKPLSVHSKNPKVRNLLHLNHNFLGLDCWAQYRGWPYSPKPI